jgi:hypothetical protein
VGHPVRAVAASLAEPRAVVVEALTVALVIVHDVEVVEVDLEAPDFDLIDSGITHNHGRRGLPSVVTMAPLHLSRKIETSVRSSRAPDGRSSPLSQCDLRHILHDELWFNAIGRWTVARGRTGGGHGDAAMLPNLGSNGLYELAVREQSTSLRSFFPSRSPEAHQGRTQCASVTQCVVVQISPCTPRTRSQTK